MRRVEGSTEGLWYLGNCVFGLSMGYIGPGRMGVTLKWDVRFKNRNEKNTIGYFIYIYRKQNIYG